MAHIEQKHEHLKTLQFIDGKWVKKCIHHECEYQEEVKQWELYENDM